MDLGLRDKAVLVTGGSSGIGLACVELLLEEGARVATCARDKDRLDEVLAPLARTYPDRLLWRAADVVAVGEVAAFVGEVGAEFGQLDGLVNNAGASRVSTFATTSDQDWQDEFALKFYGALNPLHASRDLLKAAGQASVVNLNAVLARQPEKHLVATSAMRAGLLNLSKSLAAELSDDGIRVNSVCVGLIDTGQWKRRFEQQDEVADFATWAGELSRDRGALMGRFGLATEVAATIVFLLSARSSFTTGTAFEVAGGVSRYV